MCWRSLRPAGEYLITPTAHVAGLKAVAGVCPSAQVVAEEGDHGWCRPGTAGDAGCDAGLLPAEWIWSRRQRRCAGGVGDIAGPAAGAGRSAGGRAREGRRGILRLGGEPHAAVAAPPAGRRLGGRAGRSGARMGRDRDRGVRTGVLRQPVRVDGAAVRALRDPAVDAGSGGRVDWHAGTTSRPCWRSAYRPSGRSSGPGSGFAPRWPPRPGSRAGTWAVGRRTDTGSPTPDRTRIRRTRPGDAARTGSSRTR